MRVPSPGREDPLEEGVATRSSALAGESYGQRSRVGMKGHIPDLFDVLRPSEL